MIKDGYKTSEVWVAIFTKILAILVIYGYITVEQSKEWLELIAILLPVIIPGVAYMFNRTWLKSKMLLNTPHREQSQT